MIVDRITESRVYLEDGGAVRPFPRAALPAGLREGDVLVLTADGWKIDAETTQKRRELMKKRLERLIR